MEQFTGKDADALDTTEHVEQLTDEVQETQVDSMTGHTDRRIFWTVLLASLFLMAGMFVMVSKGAVALAANIPVPLTIRAGTLNGSNFHLYPGISKADNTSPTGVAQMDCTISNLSISKQIQVPVVGNVTFSLNSGNSTAATLTGLTTDISSLNTSQASFQSMSFNTGGNGLDINATSTTLNNANISSPYLLVNSITLPGLSLSINAG